MKRADVFSLLQRAGLPTTYRSWGDAKPSSLPYIVFFQTGRSDFMADDSNYGKAVDYCAELYSETKDDERELAVEQALEGCEIAYTKNEIGAVSDGPHMVAWYFTVPE